MFRSCTIADCDKPYIARGFCGKHYMRWLRHDDPLISHRAPSGSGYMTLGYWAFERPGRKTVRRSRLVWEAAFGPIASGYVIHHRNGDTLDDSLENLQILSRSDHNDYHKAGLVIGQALINQAKTH